MSDSLPKPENSTPADKPAGIERIPTGIEGLDEILCGGIPRGRSVLFTGPPGCGKTIFLCQFLHDGITKFGENGVLVSFEEDPDQICANARTLGWDFERHQKDLKLRFVFSPPENVVTVEGGAYNWFTVILRRIEDAIEKIDAKRVAIDSMGTFFGRFLGSKEMPAIRLGVYNFMQALKKKNIAVLFSAERMSNDSELSRFGVEEFVSDAIISLTMYQGQNRLVRNLNVTKLRGGDFRSGKVDYDITSEGIIVYPKIPTDTSHAATDFDIRFKMGIKGLDELMDGGLPQGHILLLAGNTGTGKSLFGMQFLNEGAANGQAGLWVALEEAIPQVKKTGMAHGWDFEAHEKQGKIRFVTSSLLDISPDKLLYQIVKAVEETGATRVVIDSVSSLESGAFSKDSIRDFLIQAAGYFKKRGLCCIMNYLSSENFSQGNALLMSNSATNEMRLSSIVDSIILLRYAERDTQVHKLLNILKLRGSNHEKNIIHYEIEKGGLMIGKQFR